MNPRFATSAGILAIAGLLFHMAVPSERSSAPASEPQKTQLKKEKAAEEKAPRHFGPWTATCRYFGKPVRPITAELATRADFCLSAAGPAVDFVIATIPDPTRTRLGQITDRAIESIQRAAQNKGWDFDSIWLPWVYKSDPDDEEIKKWQPVNPDNPEPGLLVFRRAASDNPDFPGRLLLVFLVGETPTSGIDLEIMHKAECYGQRLTSPRTPLRIAGPTFTGSLPSLARDAAGTKVPYTVASGTATNEKYIAAFRNPNDPAFRDRVRFQSFAANGDEIGKELCATADRLMIDHRRVAILAEDETSFGGRIRQPCRDGFVITFPREISSLRNASVEGAAAADKTGTSGRLPFSLRDADGGEDGTPLIDKKHSPQTQYAVVNAIIREVRARASLVEIASTNVLDALFLAKVVREGSPDTRIVVPEPDLLFIRAARADQLPGILSFSPYPPVFWNKAPLDSLLIPFPDSRSRGLYDALLFLLADDRAPSAPVSRRTLWTVESTPNGYWPVIPEQALKVPHIPAEPVSWTIVRWIPVGLALWLIIWVLWSILRTTRSSELFESNTSASAWFVVACVAILASFQPLPWGTGLGIRTGLHAWTAHHLGSGYSPLVPIVLLEGALLLWTWERLWRLSFARHRNPGLPLPLMQGVRSSMQSFQLSTESALSPNTFWTSVATVVSLAGALVLVYLTSARLHLATFNGEYLTGILAGLAALVFASVAETAYRLIRAWLGLKGVLRELDRLPLEGAFRRLPREYSAAIWMKFPNRRTYAPLFRSRDCLEELSGRSPILLDADLDAIRTAECTGGADHIPYRAASWRCRLIANFLLQRRLEPAWAAGTRDPDPGDSKTPPTVVPALPASYALVAEFVTLRYAAWIRHVVAQMRNLVWHISGGYALLCIALTTLGFQSPQAIRYFLTVAFLVIGVPVVWVMAQIEKNPVLSRMADTNAGQLNLDFYGKFAAYGLLPLVGLLSNDFPGFASFLTSWLQPTLEALK